MPDKRSHRGAHPQDAVLFGQNSVADLQHAVGDLSLLMSRGYAIVSSLKLVGDRYQLDRRQRIAVGRSSCADDARDDRLRRRQSPDDIVGETILLDGFNVLVTIETALAGGVVLHARDGCFRDMASMHGTYRKMAETSKALQAIGRELQSLKLLEVVWYFDRPVSNSGRLKAAAKEIAELHDWPWRIELVDDPDRILIESGEIVASADSLVLDNCDKWFNLARHVVQARVPDAWVINLSARGDRV